MSKDIIILNLIILFYIIQRLSEMVISNQNEKLLKEKYNAVEVSPKESIRMKIFHILWFISLITEANLKQNYFSGLSSLLIYSVLGFCLAIRFHSMEKLKSFWTIKIFSMDEQKIVTDGLYRYIRHPNYLVVIIEFIFLPLLFKSYFTLIVFSILNIFILKKRIELEEATLMAQSNYNGLFMNIKKLTPFFSILVLFISYSLSAKELNFHFKDYKEAKKAENFIRFEGESTKLGFITTSFDGYIKDFRVNYELVNNQLRGLTVNIATDSLDTDIDSRNEKMVKKILEGERYPLIKAEHSDQVNLIEGEQTIEMIFIIKGKKISRPVNFLVEKKADGYLIKGNTSIGFKEAELPDPSIAIATVNDTLKLNFSIIL